jgi:ubiquinone/menaquinone biosynthesis C-methylase UbiE
MSLSLKHRGGRTSFYMSSLRMRVWLARHLRGKFPGLYSTLDDETEVPVQVAAYRFVTEHYIHEGDTVLDVGFGLGYGLEIMAERAGSLSGIEIDRKAIARLRRSLVSPKIQSLEHYDAYSIPFPERSFDVVTCIDVIEHVPDYLRLITSMCNVSRHHVVVSTPNRRPEHTNGDGSPKNPWHIREWNYEEFDQILRQLDKEYEWNFLNGPWEGPFTVSQRHKDTTLALTPAIIIGDR